ncbi:MAG: hypothetical protein D3917_05215 [Candidatus Electrothrix sp. AX5]|jgi:hypothetical protein|nr:hypothetical protein [Candidatus Electrothrix sp. AX5]
MKNIDNKFVLKWLIFFNVILVFLHIVLNHIFPIHSYTIKHWFDLSAETNIPTWFSSIQLFSLFSLSVIYAIHLEDIYLRKFYILIGLIFLFFSVDETAMIHEGITSIFKKLSIHSFFPDAHGLWILVYLIMLIIFSLIFLKGILLFLKEKNGRAIFIIGAVVFVVGGVGLEVFGYYLRETKPIIYIIEVTVEESFELLGQSLMIYALLLKLYPESVTL